MATVAVVGAGDIGGAIAQALASCDRAHRVWLVDPAAGAAAGKALDLQQAGAVTGRHTRLDGTIVRDQVFTHLPTIVEAYQSVHGGKMPSGPIFEAFKNFANMGVAASKSIVLPKGTPDKIVDTWVAAAKKTMNDPKFKKVVKKRLGPYPHFYGKDALAVLRNATDMKPSTRAWLKKWLNKKFGVNM